MTKRTTASRLKDLGSVVGLDQGYSLRCALSTLRQCHSGRGGSEAEDRDVVEGPRSPRLYSRSSAPNKFICFTPTMSGCIELRTVTRSALQDKIQDY